MSVFLLWLPIGHRLHQLETSICLFFSHGSSQCFRRGEGIEHCVWCFRYMDVFGGKKHFVKVTVQGILWSLPYKWVCTSSKKCVDWNYCFVWEFAQKITNATLKIDTFFSYLVTPVFHQQCLYLTGLYDFFYKHPLCLCTEREPMPCVL